MGLVEAGKIPPGDVLCKSITEISPDDCRRYTQCHFFCGIAGWSVALALAEWPDDKPVWTGSCPCQPFSSAGSGKGAEDERHLWPAFHSLISQCKPSTVFGEQVASPNGRLWLTAVRSDLEAVGYAVGAVDLCAAGVGAPHIRQRLYWVANANDERQPVQLRTGPEEDSETRRCSPVGRMADAAGVGHETGLRVPRECVPQMGEEPLSELSCLRQSPWHDPEWIYCRDGKYRPVEPGISPLADGVPGRLVQLCGYGNAINTYQAATFIAAAANDNYAIS